MPRGVIPGLGPRKDALAVHRHRARPATDRITREGDMALRLAFCGGGDAKEGSDWAIFESLQD